MDKRVILAVAGAGKTYHICNSINPKEKNLILAYTHENIKNIKKELLKKFGKIPELTTVITYHSFIYRYIILPYQPTILKHFKCENYISNGITMKSPPPQTIKENGKIIPNKLYKRKSEFEHYIYRKYNLYYCDTLSELILQVKEGKEKLIIKATKNINNMYDKVLIDEFQDFRKNDFELIVQMCKKINSVLLVGDYYQHSVSAVNNSGKPFSSTSKDSVTGRKKLLLYDEFIDLLKDEKFLVDNASLSCSRRCPKDICEFVSRKTGIAITHDNNNQGNVYFVADSNIDKILTNDAITKLVWEEANKYSFKAINWSYSKGDTLDNVCIILTSTLDCIDNENFNFSDISQITLNKLYVAMTRTQGDLHIIKHQQFNPIKSKYLFSNTT